LTRAKAVEPAYWIESSIVCTFLRVPGPQTKDERQRALREAIAGSLAAFYALNEGRTYRSSAATLPLAIEWLTALVGMTNGAPEAAAHRHAIVDWLADTLPEAPPCPNQRLAMVQSELVELAREVTGRGPPKYDPSSTWSETEWTWWRMRLETRGPPPPEPATTDRLFEAVEAVVLASGGTPAAELEAMWTRVVEVQASHDAWDSDFTPSPHEPWRERAKIATLGAKAVPFLIEHLDDRDPVMRGHALKALEEIGPPAQLALPSLMARAIKLWPARTLCAIDVRAALACGLHAFKLTRADVIKFVIERRPLDDRRRHVVELLGGDAELQGFVLAGDDGFQGLVAHPELLPREEVIELLDSSDEHVASAAASALLAARVHGPWHRIVEILSAPGRRTTATEIESVADLELSDRLIPSLVAAKAFDLLELLARTRRHAGCAIHADQLRAFLDVGLSSVAPVVPALAIAAELDGKEALAPAVEVAATRWRCSSEAYRFRIATGKERPHLFKLEAGDLAFVRGEIVSAGQDYDYVFLADAMNAHAAFQLAWIARAFGAVIERRRVDWIRSLGFRDGALLDELARPTRPLDGFRGFWKPQAAGFFPEGEFLERIERTRAAGLSGIAAREAAAVLDRSRRDGAPTSRLLELEAERTRCLDRARTHVEHVRAASR
jgi:hypothetical protein